MGKKLGRPTSLRVAPFDQRPARVYDAAPDPETGMTSIPKPPPSAAPPVRAALLACVLAAACAPGARAQAPTLEIGGTVTAAADQRPLGGAAVYVVEAGAGAATALDGSYRIAFEPPGAGDAAARAADSVTVRFSYVGYATATRRVALAGPRARLDVQLAEGVALAEVTVRADGFAEQFRSTQMSVERVDAREAKLLPALLGEADILKTITLKPGIPSGGEGTTGLYVRGGGTGQNLILLDGATVYNPNHLFGFFSTFNADAVEDLSLYKGGFPARYGGRLSSVIDVGLRDGRTDRIGATGGIGLIASRLTLEGPLGRRDPAGGGEGDGARGSWIVSGRRTYIDLITDQINRVNADVEDFNPIPAYNFYDLNARGTYRLGERDRVYVSGYFGRDEFRFDDENFDFGFDWGNLVATARWNHEFSPRLFLDNTVAVSDYDYVVRNEIPGFSFEVGSAIRSWSATSDLTYAPTERHALRFGGSLTRHAFEVGRLQGGSDDGEIGFSAGDTYGATELGAHASDEFELARWLRGSAGVRLAGWVNDGASYWRLEPRAALNVTAGPRVALKASYARMHQFVHLVASAGVALPTDIWYPSTPGVAPQRSDQVAAGVNYLLAPEVMVKAETYYKWLGNQVDFVDGAELFVNDDLEAEFDFGRGRAYGLELQVERRRGRLRGWVGYTWQRTERSGFPNIMQGRAFNPRYDRRHDVSVVAFYELSPRWRLTGTWVYGSGDLYWLPIGRKLEQGPVGGDEIAVLPVYGDRNNYRLRPFHRGDVGAVLKLRPKRGESDLTFSVFNVYDRRNAFFVYIDLEYEPVEAPDGREIEIPSQLSPKQVSLFPVLPSVTWNFKF